MKRIVIKLGTSTLTHENGLININQFKKLVKVISKIKSSGIEVIIVSSGAIGMGMGKLKLNKKPENIHVKQFVSAVGQPILMALYEKHFSEYNNIVGQILLTKDVIDDEIKTNNFRQMCGKMLDFSVIPIVNENDSISTDEIEEVSRFGDNDTLSAIVAKLTNADTLIILSDIDGLFDKDPNLYEDAKIIPIVNEITTEIINLCGDSLSILGTGGMLTKIKAAELCFKNGIDMAIINGDNPNNLINIINEKNIGTWFISDKPKVFYKK